MVYNLNGMAAYVTLVLNYLVGFWQGKTLDECLWSKTDGFMIRYYTSNILKDLVNVFFPVVTFRPFGQDADAIPLPRRLCYHLMRMMSNKRLANLANKRGAFLFMIADK
jgi:hypothetical protein